MKTLLLTLDFAPRLGGVARYLRTLAEAFASDVLVMAPHEPGDAAFDAQAPYPIERHKLLTPFVWPSWLPMVVLLLKKNDQYARVLVSHVLPCATAARIASFVTKRPYAVIVHGMDVSLAVQHPWKRRVAAWALRGAEMVYTNSQSLADEVRGVFDLSHVRVSYPCIETMPAPLETARPQEAGLRLLTVGRLVKRKGHERVLQAIATLIKQGNGHLVSSYSIVGSGPMEQDLDALAQQLGIRERVHFLGALPDDQVQTQYQQADVFVMPTAAGVDREGFGLVYIEAAAHGVPSIASRLPGVDEAVIDTKTGLCVADGDKEALAKAIAYLAEEPELRKKFGAAARVHATTFTKERQTAVFAPFLHPVSHSRISVIVPSYQHATTIGACLDSLLAQTRKIDEIIVVDDGSTDNTQQVLAPYLNRGVRVITQENKGSNPARNVGHRASSGDLLMFCDADAVLRPDTIESMERTLAMHPEASYVYGGFRFGWKTFSSFPFSAERLRQMNYIHTSSLIRREHFPGFDEAVARLQDWDVWLTMLEQGHCGVFIPRCLFTIIDDHGRIGISRWLPRVAYRIPWNTLGWMPTSVKKFEAAREAMIKKHHLSE